MAKILSEREHPAYSDNINDWLFYSNAVRGGSAFANEENLFSHRLEDADDYQQRLERLYYLNYCDCLSDIYNSYIFRENIRRPPDLRLEQFRNNCDGKGTSISEFIKKCGKLSDTYGAVHILVDISKSNKKQPSVADAKASGISPFAVAIPPTKLKDWSVNSKGEFRWVLYEYLYYNDDDPTKDRIEETHYKIITTDEWWIENEKGKPITFADGTESKGKNSLGFIPIYTMYRKESEVDKIGVSMLTDIAGINRIIMNWCSLIDEQMERNTFSQLITPDDSAMDEDEQRGRDPLDRIGTSSIFTFNPESKHPPSFISPETSTITTIWKIVADHVKEIFRLAGLQGGTSDLYTSRSGRQSQQSFMGVDSSLAEKALTYQKCENAISRLAYKQLGISDEYDNVKYPTSFNTVALNEEIDGILKILERNFSTTLNKTIIKEVARKTTPLVSENTKETIEQEIDAGDGIVKPTPSNFRIQAEKEGDGNPASNLSDSFKTKDVKDREESSHRTQS